MIVCFGSINLDLIFELDHLPTAGETVIGPSLRMEPGGKGANQACAAARDGAAVAMAGAVGQDALAEAALPMLIAAGVDLSRVARLDAATGAAGICVNPQGQNQICVGSGANLLVRHSQVEDAALGPGTTLLLQMECDPGETAALIHRAHARGARIVLNLAPAAALAEDALRAVDVLVVNETEAAWLAGHLGVGDAAAALQAALGGIVVVTLGAAGAEAAGADLALRIAALPIVARDTTAAGDCFTGVLAAALDRGASVADALRRANTAAGLCATSPGSQSSLPWSADIDHILNG
jgi:ribokinase